MHTLAATTEDREASSCQRLASSHHEEQYICAGSFQPISYEF